MIIIFLGIIFIDGLKKMDSLPLFFFLSIYLKINYTYIIYRRNHVKVFIYTLTRVSEHCVDSQLLTSLVLPFQLLS